MPNSLHDEKQNGRILVVEDDEIGRHALCRLLTAMGFTVTEAATVAEGLERLNDHSSLILDLNLPDGNGMTLLQEARARNRPVKVAIYTGIEDTTLLAQANKDRPDGLFSKPVDLPALLDWVEQMA